MLTLHIAAACLFDAEQRLLLVRKRQTRPFMLPGGKREAGESPLQTLRRELREELRVELPEDTLRHLGRFQAPAANEADTWLNAEIYTAELGLPVSAAAEIAELAWLDLSRAPGLPLAPLLERQLLPYLRQSARLLAQ